MSRNPHYIKLINSTRWKKLRVEKLRSNPICEHCEAKGFSILATEVHHDTEVESVSGRVEMERLMFNWSNLVALCHSCHAEEHRIRFSHSKEAVQANNRRRTESFIERFLKDKY